MASRSRHPPSLFLCGPSARPPIVTTLGIWVASFTLINDTPEAPEFLSHLDIFTVPREVLQTTSVMGISFC